MKAGAFGRTPQRRDVQPGGLALPGMFSSRSPTPGPSTSSSTPPAKPASSDSTSPLLSSWGTTKARPARAVSIAEPSRLERLQEERRRRETEEGLSARRRVASMSAGEGAAAESDSISRARRLGLNRASNREPSPPASEGEEEKEGKGWLSSAPAKQIAMLPGMSSFKRSSSPPPATPPGHHRAASVDAPVPRTETAGDQPTTLFGSLWGRAAQLVGAGGAAGEHVVKEVPPKQRDESGVSELPVPESKVTPFKLHDGDEAEGDGQEQSDTRAVALPPFIVRALSDPTATTGRSRRVTVPDGPYLPPITYRRPPPLYPRDIPLAAGGPASLAVRPGGRFIHRDPYDWLEARDESPIDPYLFHRAVGRAATRKGKSRAVRNVARPGMPVATRTEPGPGAMRMAAVAGAGMGTGQGMAAAVGGAGPPPGMEGLFRTLTTHPSLPPSASYLALASPVPNPAHNAVTGFVPQLPQHGYDQPPAAPHPLTLRPAPTSGATAYPMAPGGEFLQPAYPTALTGVAPVAAVGAAGVAGGYTTAHIPQHSTIHPEAAVSGAVPVSGLSAEASLEHAHAVEQEHPGLTSAGQDAGFAIPPPPSTVTHVAPIVGAGNEAFPRSATGPNGLPVFPAPAPPTPAPQVAPPSPPEYNAPPPPLSSGAPGPAAASATAASQPLPPPTTSHSAAATAPLSASTTALPTPAPALALVPAPARTGPGPIRAALGAQFSSGPPPTQLAAHPPGTTYHSQYGFLPPGSLTPFSSAVSASGGHVPAPLPTPHPDTGSGTGATGGLPAMPIPRPILSSTPSPGSTPPALPATMTQTAPSFYPSQLLPAIQQQQQQPRATIYPPVVRPAVADNAPHARANMPQPMLGGATPNLSVRATCAAAADGETGGATRQQQGAVVTSGTEGPAQGEEAQQGGELQDEKHVENDPDLPTYTSTSPPSSAPTLSVPGLAALNTPLSPSPAPPASPSPLPSSPIPELAPVLALSSLDFDAIVSEKSLLPAYGTAPTPPLTSSSLIPALTDPSLSSPFPPPTLSIPSKFIDESIAPSSAELVFTPPTPIAPQATPLPEERVAHSSQTASVVETAATVGEEQDCPTSTPTSTSRPSLEPLSLSFSLGDFNSSLGEFAFDAISPTGALPSSGDGFLSLASFGLDKVGVTEEEEGREMPYPMRASSPMAEFGTEVDEEPEEEDDPLSDAFEAATHFATSFAQADLARASADPNHTERTERWLAQMGVERRNVGDLTRPAAPSLSKVPSLMGRAETKE
ncbi:hypothetical protein JCM11251_007172 [Rhodosporidiobolus azoricus]